MTDQPDQPPVSSRSSIALAKLTIADVAASLGVSRERVDRWIRDGELVAVDLSTSVDRGPRMYRITPAALAEFEARRGELVRDGVPYRDWPRPEPPKPVRKPQPWLEDVIEFF